MGDLLLTEQSKSRIADIAKRDLETQFKGEVSLVEINVETRLTNDGEPYTHISMVYDSPQVTGPQDPVGIQPAQPECLPSLRPHIHHHAVLYPR